MKLKEFEEMIAQIIKDRGTCVVLDYNGHHVPSLSSMNTDGTFEESEWVSKEQKRRALGTGQIWTVSYDGGPDVDGYPSGVYLRGASLPLVLLEVISKLEIPVMDDFLRTVSYLEDILMNNIIGPKATVMLSFGVTDKGMEPPAATTAEWFEHCGVKTTEFLSPEEYQKVLAAKQYWDINWFTGERSHQITGFSRYSAKASELTPVLGYIESINPDN